MHAWIQFIPLPGKEDAFRAELEAVIIASRSEAGCVAMHGFESLRAPAVFAIHSEWVDEAAFELHARMPHTLRFLEAAGQLLTNPVQALRIRPLR